MEKIEIDLKGEIRLVASGGRKTPIHQEYSGHANIYGSIRQDSYTVYIIGKTELSPGEKCKADFVFAFGHDQRFKLKVSVGQVLDLNEGRTKIGEFRIDEILNERLKSA